MAITFDETKRQANIAMHGIDLGRDLVSLMVTC